MKLKKKVLHQQRRQLDEMILEWVPTRGALSPRLGWIKAIRESLGMSSRQLAQRVKTNNAAILRLEKRETKGTATLKVIERAARALGCQLVYAIVPINEGATLEKMVDQKAYEAATRILKPVAHSMKLEDQQVSEGSTTLQIKTLAQELKEQLDPVLWEK